MTSAPQTVLEAVQLLEAEGYRANFVVRPDGTLRCGVCAQTHRIDGALVDRVYRFEGVSDPDDEAIVLGVRCPNCDAKGVVVSGFGPSADPAVLQHLRFLDARFREREEG